MANFCSTDRNKALTIAMATLSLLSSPMASALSCKEQYFESFEAQELFGQASLVFKGTLRSIESIKASLSQPAPPAPYGVPQGTGIFVAESVYKGNSDSELRVRIDASTQIGARYMVFANKDAEILHAFDPCWQLVIRPSVESEGYSQFLSTLPPPQSGGDVWIYFPKQPSLIELRVGALEIEGTGRKFSVTPKIGEIAVVKQIPAGTYRLVTPPPAGYEFVCNVIGDCDDLKVFDRGLERWSFELKETKSGARTSGTPTIPLKLWVS